MADAWNNGTSMKIRILSIACIASAATLLAACTIATRNSSACEQLMRSKLADSATATAADTLRVTHRGAAIRGSRVVVEGTIEHRASAPAASATAAASAALVASAPQAASDLEVAARAAAPAAAPKKTVTPAAAECTFHGETLDVFRWLAPEKLAAPAGAAPSDSDAG
jgi:hypothetical protein